MRYLFAKRGWAPHGKGFRVSFLIEYMLRIHEARKGPL
jgi:hypothetical protein